MHATPVLALLPMQRTPAAARQRVIWIADGAGCLYAAPTAEQRADIVERVFYDGSGSSPCGDCIYCAQSGDGWNEPRSSECAVLAGDYPAEDCPGYADELAAWEEEQCALMPEDQFERLISVAQGSEGAL